MTDPIDRLEALELRLDEIIARQSDRYYGIILGCILAVTITILLTVAFNGVNQASKKPTPVRCPFCNTLFPQDLP